MGRQFERTSVVEAQGQCGQAGVYTLYLWRSARSEAAELVLPVELPEHGDAVLTLQQVMAMYHLGYVYEAWFASQVEGMSDVLLQDVWRRQQPVHLRVEDEWRGRDVDG